MIKNVTRIVLYSMIYSLLIVLTSYLVSFVFFKKEIALNLPVIRDYQKFFYFQTRNILQQDLDCIEFDFNLIYRLKDGTCKFNNVEYKTLLTIQNHQRVVPSSKNGKNSNGIAVLGDSFALGWGVDDNETFANEISTLSGRKVSNLAVSSYGSYREIFRFLEFADNSKVKTIVLQYCANDLEENITYLKHGPEGIDSMKKFASIADTRDTDKHILSKDFFAKMFTIPINQLLNSYVKLKNGSKFHSPENGAQLHQDVFEQLLIQFPKLKRYNILVLVFGDPENPYFSFKESSRTHFLPNVRYLNLRLDKSDYFILDDHWNKSGHLNVAQQVLAKLTSLNW